MTRKNVAASISFMILIGHRPQSVIFMKTFQEKLIYLTADAEEKLESFEPEMVYVIGGIVAKLFAEQHFMAKISRNLFFDIH
jgi:Trm5-related predicted tRNA methylase